MYRRFVPFQIERKESCAAKPVSGRIDSTNASTGTEVANEFLPKARMPAAMEESWKGRCDMNAKTGAVIAEYMSLRVEVLYQLHYWSLISFEDREMIVETTDRVFVFAFEQAA